MSEARVFSELSLSDLLVLLGLMLMAGGLWPWFGPLVLVGLGGIFLVAGVWLAWPRRGR